MPANHSPVYLAIAALIVTATAFAQSPPARLVSPEVHPDRRITFRLKAPKATEVKIWGEWILKNNTLEEMKRDEQGVWSATVGPLEPALYSYIFLVDEVVVLDPLNAEAWIGREGPAGNLVNVRAGSPRDDEIRSVPRGVLNLHSTSSTGLGTRPVVIYTPPGYGEAARINYPVLYLLHGSGDTESAWSSIGRAGVIADNLIAGKRARPMIIVMPSGHVTPPNTPDPTDLRNSFNQDLVKDLLPFVDSHYRTIRTRQGRAIAGISMGAFQALWFALDHPNLVSGLGIFGGGIFGPRARPTSIALRRGRT